MIDPRTLAQQLREQSMAATREAWDLTENGSYLDGLDKAFLAGQLDAQAQHQDALAGMRARKEAGEK